MNMDAESHYHIPEAPYGWEYVKKEGFWYLRPLATEIWIIRYIRQLYAFACTIEDIIEELHYDQITPRHKNHWTQEEIKALIERDDEKFWQEWKEEKFY